MCAWVCDKLLLFTFIILASRMVADYCTGSIIPSGQCTCTATIPSQISHADFFDFKVYTIALRVMVSGDCTEGFQ